MGKGGDEGYTKTEEINGINDRFKQLIMRVSKLVRQVITTRRTVSEAASTVAEVASAHSLLRS